MLAHESRVHGIAVIQHELLNGRALARAGVPDLVKLLKKWKPGEDVVATFSGCGVVREPLS